MLVIRYVLTHSSRCLLSVITANRQEVVVVIDLALNVIILLSHLVIVLRITLLVVLCRTNVTPDHCLIQLTIAAFLLAECVSSYVHSILIIVIEIERFILLSWLTIDLIEVGAVHRLIDCWWVNRSSIPEMISILMLLNRYFGYVSFFWPTDVVSLIA